MLMEKISGYKLTGKLGEGGMAAVYKGLQVSLNRPVAIKVLLKKMADHSEVLGRFERESVIIARLTNPHIIHVIDRGITPEGMPYFVMEYVKGTDLSSVIEDGTLDFNRKLDLVIQICKALSYAHRNGVIHRDIKPSNVLIDGEENARVLDFGIAQFYSDDESDSQHTHPGLLMGTLPYMSPEQQVSAGSVTILSDLYSLGVLMYELFTRRKPVGRFQLPSEIDRTIPKPLEDIIMSCLEAEPANRPSSADEIKDCLLKLLQGAHLDTAQKKRASLGITKVEEKFALLDIIKEKPCGTVYLYEDRVEHNLLVIKKLPRKSSGFIESKLLTSLKHNNIVNILGASKNEQLFIIAMEYLSGGNLTDRLIHPHPWIDVLKTAREICDSLSFAHKNRIIHGNLRPSNILFTESGQAKVTDFGLDEHYSSKDDAVNWYNISGEPKSVYSDIFAAGVIFYQMLTGTIPEWEGTHLVPHENFRSTPIEMQELVSKMLVRKRGPRQGSFDQIVTEIDLILESYKNRMGPENLTEIIEDTAISDLSSKEPAKSSTRNLLVLFILLVILFATAAFYLVDSGNIKILMDFLLSVLEKLSK